MSSNLVFLKITRPKVLYISIGLTVLFFRQTNVVIVIGDHADMVGGG